MGDTHAEGDMSEEGHTLCAWSGLSAGHMPEMRQGQGKTMRAPSVTGWGLGN